MFRAELKSLIVYNNIYTLRRKTESIVTTQTAEMNVCLPEENTCGKREAIGFRLR